MATTESDEAAFEEEYALDIACIVPDEETTCKICYAEFLDSEDLEVHLKQMHEGSVASPKNCQFCDTTYKDLDDYARHIGSDHLLELQSCQYCTKCFADQNKAKKHERKHRGKNNLFSCSQCTGLFSTKKEVEIHEVLKHDNDEDGVLLRCMPHLSSYLKFQVATFLQADEKELKCHLCGFTSVDLNTYLNHVNNSKCEICVCNKCSNVFKGKKYMIKHFRRKYKCMDPKEYVSELTKCPLCKIEVQSTQMHEHLKICTIYNCYTCNMRFETIDGLSAHQSEVHPLELDVSKCKYCSKEYVGQTALEKHIERSHKHKFILYKYACKSCDAIFKHPQNLFAHYYTKHKELQPYTCRICNKKFKIRKLFTIHIKLEHKSAGVVEFDDQYHVFFAEKKSENPFIPTCVIPELVPSDSEKDKKVSKGVKTHKPETSKKTKFIKTNPDSDNTENESSNVETNDETNERAITMKENATTGIKRKRRPVRKKDFVNLSSSEEEDVEPLLIIKKRAERKRFQKLYAPGPKKIKEHVLKRKQLTCNICKKYCYTFQNYHNHIKIHSKNQLIECVKCSRCFTTKKELNEHVATDHATSKLIETLKAVLERKQVGSTQNVTNDNIILNEELTTTEKFKNTIKKVKTDRPAAPATIAPAPSNISAKKFIENFVPDIGESAQKDENTDPIVTIKRYDSPFYRKHTIKMTKFTPEAAVQSFKLKMPERFKEQNEEQVKLSIRLVQQPLQPTHFEKQLDIPCYENTDNSHDFDDYEGYKSDGIPEVAQEVFLEGSEEPPKTKVQAPHKIVIPKLPEDYPSIHIATLQQEAPYFKIIKVKKGPKDSPIIIDTGEKELNNSTTSNSTTNKVEDIIKLPDGTKYVTANPLAHLLDDKEMEKVLEPIKGNYYKPTIRPVNIKYLLTEALQNLDKTQQRKPKKKSVKK